MTLQTKGIAPEKVEKLDLVGKSKEEIVAVLKTVSVALGPKRRTEEAVPVADLPRLSDAGWEFVSPLSESKVVLRAPLLGGVPRHEPRPGPIGRRRARKSRRG